MPSPTEIIKEIRADADKLQKKTELLLMPENSRNFNDEQMKTALSVDDSLRGWRGWNLSQLEKDFGIDSG